MQILFIFCILLILLEWSGAILVPRALPRMTQLSSSDRSDVISKRIAFITAAVSPELSYPGLGLYTVISIYQKVIIARFALSWFPQLYNTFPFLAPVFTVTEPYLQVFRRQIPAIGGFDISAIPALLILDFAGNAAASLGAEIPEDIEEKLAKLRKKYKMKASKKIKRRL
jgi:YggT family protein